MKTQLNVKAYRSVALLVIRLDSADKFADVIHPEAYCGPVAPILSLPD